MNVQFESTQHKEHDRVDIHNKGINVEPVTDHWSGTGDSPENYFIFGFGGLKIEEIDEGIRSLAQVWFETTS
jgi:DNA-binding transcriptional MocR family regulator